MRNCFIQFSLIFCAVSLLFFPQTSVQGAKNGLILWSATITPTLLPFLLLTGFMQYYQTFHLISRLFYPLKKLFPGINEDFFYTCILGFFCVCPLGAKIIDDFISCGSFTKSEGDPSWQNFCSALFLLPVFSCHVLSDLSGLFIFYKRFSTYTPLFSHHCTQKISRSGNL